MPKVSVYLSDDLYDAARRHDISISAVTQRALEVEIGARSNEAWIDAVRSRPRRTSAVIDSAALLDDVRDDFGT